MSLTPPEQQSSAAKFPQPSASLAGLVGAIAVTAAAVFVWGLWDEPFVDEYAYITQSWYSDLFFSGKRNDPDWLEYPFAFDLQPLPKYFIGPAIHAIGVKTPDRATAVRWTSRGRRKPGCRETAGTSPS